MYKFCALFVVTRIPLSLISEVTLLSDIDPGKIYITKSHRDLIDSTFYFRVIQNVFYFLMVMSLESL